MIWYPVDKNYWIKISLYGYGNLKIWAIPFTQRYTNNQRVNQKYFVIAQSINSSHDTHQLDIRLDDLEVMEGVLTMVHYVFVQHIENDLHNFIEAFLCLQRKPSFSFQRESYEVKLHLQYKWIWQLLIALSRYKWFDLWRGVEGVLNLGFRLTGTPPCLKWEDMSRSSKRAIVYRTSRHEHSRRNGLKKRVSHHQPCLIQTHYVFKRSAGSIKFEPHSKLSNALDIIHMYFIKFPQTSVSIQCIIYMYKMYY